MALYGIDSNKSRSEIYTKSEVYNKTEIDSVITQKIDPLSTRVTNLENNKFDKTGGTVTGNITAPGFIVSSSRKVKENINSTIIDGVETLMKVRVVDFNYKDDKNKVPKVGLIAEDSPDILVTPEKDAMDTGNCIGVLMKAVQELIVRVDYLESVLEMQKINR